jgi:hypothetical protein
MCDSILKPDENDKSTNTDINNNTHLENENSNDSFNKPVESNDSNECSESNDCYEHEYDYDYEYEYEYDGKFVSFIAYDLYEEQNLEKLQNEYHIKKQSGDWYYAKMIVSHAYQDKNNTDLFCDHLEKQFLKNGDSFNNIITAYYKNDLDIDIIYQFSQEPAKHLIDNLRIPPYKPHGIIFSNPEDANKWSFKIVVITNKGIYTANRYITDDLIGFY